MTLEPPQGRSPTQAQPSEAEINEMLRAAIQVHGQGGLEEAEEAYRRILQIAPGQPHALHLLGVIAYQAGQAESAVQLISQAIAVLGHIPDFHNNIGEAYRSLGRYEEAITHYRRALTLDTVNPGAACNMGSALFAQGNFHGAIAAFKKALGFKPDFAEAKAKLGAALVRLPKDDPERDLDRGIALLREGLRANPTLTEGILNLADALAEKGEAVEAIRLYRQAAERAPDDSAIQVSLTMLLMREGEIEEAKIAFTRTLAIMPSDADLYLWAGDTATDLGFEFTTLMCFQRAAEVAPERADVHEKRARAQQRNSWYNGAAESYRRVLAIEPGRQDLQLQLGDCLVRERQFEAAAEIFDALRADSPDTVEPLVATGRMLVFQGRHDEGAQYYLKARDLDPWDPRAYFNLAVTGTHELSDQDIALVRDAAANESLDAVSRATARFTLGGTFHNRGEYDAAFDHYAAGNAAIHALPTRRNRTDREPLVDSSISIFDSAFFEDRWMHGDNSDRPVFVVGLPRAGKTTVEGVLSGHPEVAAAGELVDLQLMSKFIRFDIGSKQPYPYNAPELDSAAARGMARRYLEHLDEIVPQGRRVINTLPQNYIYIGLIALLFPDAKVIDVRRDPLENCLSCYFKFFRQDIRDMWDFGDLANHYKTYRRYMDHWHAIRPIEILEVQFEDLVAHPEPAARRMIDFIGLEWDDRCLGNDDDNLAGQPLYKSSGAISQHYEKHLGPLIEALKS